MAKPYFVTRIQDINISLHFRFYTKLFETILVLHSYLLTFTSPIPITPSDTENYLSSDDPNITNRMVSHDDCEKRQNLRPFNLLNVKQCTEAPSNIKHASVKARVYVRAKAKPNKVFKCVAYAKKERKICFHGSVTYRRVDRTVWNPNTLPLPVTLDHLECKNLIRHLMDIHIIDGHTLPCYFADGFCKPTTKTPFTLCFSDDFCLIFTLQDFTFSDA